MAEESVKKVYDISIQGSEALKTLADLKLRAKELKDQQKALGEVTEANAEQYYKLDSQIKATNQQAAQYQKQVTNSIKLQNTQEQSLEALRTQLSLDNAEFAKLGNAQKDLARKDELGKRIAATTEELKRQEEALGDHRRSVGDYGKAVADLKTELSSLTDQLVVMAANGDTSSEAYQTMIARAGELKVAQDRVNQSIDQVGRGTESISALTGAVGGVTAAYGLWTAASAVLGAENEELDKVMKQMMTVITALNSLTAINNALSKTNATYRAAQNIVDKANNSFVIKSIKARATQNATTAAGTIATKAATAATWLWNAALAANPVVIVTIALVALIAGIAALAGAFKGSDDATKAYNATLEESERLLKKVNAQVADNIADLELQRDKAIEAARARGASEAELAELQLSYLEKIAEEERRLAQTTIDRLKADHDALVEKYRAQSKGRMLTKEEQAELNAAYGEMTRKIKEQNRVIERSFLLVQTKTREVSETIKNDAKSTASAVASAADKALQAAIAASQGIQKLQEEEYKTGHIYISDNIQAQQEYQLRLFRIQQSGEQERLALQRNAGKITAAEYADQLRLLGLAEQQFNDKQLLDLNAHYKKVRDDLVAQVDKTVDQQIGEATAKYSKAMEDLASMQPPARISGMSDDEYAEMLKEYEAFIFTRATIEEELARNLEAEIQAIRDASLAEQIKRFDDALEKEYKGDLAKYADNERKKLEIQAEMLRKQIEQRKAVGEETYDLEAQLRANGLALAGLDYERDVSLGKNSAKARYEARKRFLEAELAAAGDNADKIRDINGRMAENERTLFEERMQKFADYTAAVSDMMSALNDLITAQGEAELQRISEKYEKQHAELDNLLERNLISQAEYDREKTKLEKAQAKEEAKIERQKAIREKASKVFSVTTDTAKGIMGAVAASPLTGGLPWSAIVAAIGATQLAAILAEPLPQAARGKFIKGKRHSAGGTMIEAEDGEVVINRRSTSMFLPLLSAINEMGGGVPFTTIGSDGGYSHRSALASRPGITGSEMNTAIQEAFENATVVATIEDIRRADTNYATIESRGNI